MATIRQQIAVQKLSEIVRKSKGQKNITMGKIMRAAGFSEESSLKPKRLTESKGFRELFDKLIPDSLLTERHEQLLGAVELDSYRMDAKLSDEEIEKMVEATKGFKVRKILRTKGEPTVLVYFWRPDNMARDRALDKGYKIKGHYAAEKQEIEGTITTVNVVKYGAKKE